MKCSVLSVMKEVGNFSEADLQELKTMSGKDAGICYQKEGYFNTPVSDPVKAASRFTTVANTGHHSISGHAKVKVLLEGISKMTAIILNSLQCYDTSEKSGRYTIMTGNSEEEQKLYSKWCILFKKRITELKPDIDDDMLTNLMKKRGHDDVIITNGVLANDSIADYDEEHINVLNECKNNSSLPSNKLAQENARYVLSVFTRSTTMSYTTSLRQWNYIYDWCIKYCDNFFPKADEEYAKVLAGDRGTVKIISKETNSEASYFETRLYYDLLELSNFIYDNLYVEELRDFKGRTFDCLTTVVDKASPMKDYVLGEDDNLDLSYNVSYNASFVHIAQAQRHRTLKYFMRFNTSSNTCDFFIPSMIRGTDLEDEWLEDLNSIKDTYPQASLIEVIECGTLDNFILKCEERLCGRAQWEVMNQTKLTTERFITEANKGDKSLVFKNYVNKLKYGVDGIKTKGMLINTCKEDCMWGCKNALNRPF